MIVVVVIRRTKNGNAALVSHHINASAIKL
jgi:hypothetical protein